MTWEQTEFMEARHVVEDNQGWFVHFVNLAHVLLGVDHALKTGRECRGISGGWTSFMLITICEHYTRNLFLYELHVFSSNIFKDIINLMGFSNRHDCFVVGIQLN